MTIDPRWSICLSLALAILGVLAGGASQFTDLGLDIHTVKAIQASIILLLGVGNAINTVLTGIPSKNNTTGFIVKGPDKPVS